jgi:oxygen-independent coproporphyrinogen-3 oxidase
VSVFRGRDEDLGIYVSVPFCRHKCSFCNFASGVSTDATIAKYVVDLVAEIRGARAAAERMGARLPERVDTVYFGGGTPSLLESSQFEAIFRALRESFAIDAEAEITLEAAPGQIGAATLEAGLREGVNRVSLGVQSFVDREAAAVGRTHTGQSCFAEVERLRREGIRNVGLDLIAGLPYQTAESWEISLGAVGDSGVTHASVYLLEVDEDSRLGREVLKRGTRFHAPGVLEDEAAADLYERACDRLPEMGFEQYEISNFARDGFQSRHNRKYWERAPYLGLGLDAASMLRTEDGGALRFSNTDELASYGFGLTTKPVIVDAAGAFEESLFLGLRLLEGVEIGSLEQKMAADVRESAKELVREGLMEKTETRWRLTTRGRLVSNEVFGRLLESVAV